MRDGGSPDYFRTAHLFAPIGTSLILNTTSPLQAWLGATLLGPLPTVRAHNIVLLCGLAANGMVCYQLAYHVARRVAPAVMAGTAFASCAYVTVHLLGHFNLVHAWVLPLAALAWIALLESPSASRAAAAGAAFAVVAYSDYYYLVYAVIFAAAWWAVTATEARLMWRADRLPRIRRALLAISLVAVAAGIAISLSSGVRLQFGAVRVSATSARNPTAVAGLCLLAWAVLQTSIVRARDWTALTTRRIVTFVAIAVAVSIVLALPLIGGAVSLIASGDYVSQRYFWRSAPPGVDLATLALGNPLHTISGSSTRAAYDALGIDGMEQTAWLGIVPLLLLAGAIRFRGTLPASARPWFWITGIFAVWSLGPYLRVAGMDTGVLLPQVLARYIPIVSNARMPGRAFAVVQLAVCVIAAIAVTCWRWSTARVAASTALIVLEGLTAPYPLYRLPQADAIDATLRSLPPGAVVELPTGTRDGFGEWGRFDQDALAHQTMHGQQIVGGAVSRVPPRVTAAYHADPAIRALIELSADAVVPDALPEDLGSRLSASGIRYIVVNTDRVRGPIREAFARRHLTFMMVDGTRELYRVGE